jgi:hypothetical protein
MELIHAYLKMKEKANTISLSYTIKKGKRGWDFVEIEPPQDIASKYLRAQRHREMMKYMKSNGNSFNYNLFC